MLLINRVIELLLFVCPGLSSTLLQLCLCIRLRFKVTNDCVELNGNNGEQNIAISVREAPTLLL